MRHCIHTAGAAHTFDTWRDSMIAFIMSDFKVFHKPPPSPPPSLTMSLLPCGERLALQTARCGATITSSCWEWDLTCETTTHTRSLTHTSWCNERKTTSQGCLCMVRHWNNKSIVKVRHMNRKTDRAWRELFFFHSQLRSWVFIPSVCTEIYKTLTPANPAATKTGRRQQETGRYSQNTPMQQTTKP